MKQTDLIRKPEDAGCVLVRRGRNHDWYRNPRTGRSQLKIDEAAPPLKSSSSSRSTTLHYTLKARKPKCFRVFIRALLERILNRLHQFQSERQPERVRNVAVPRNQEIDPLPTSPPLCDSE